jgi:hypothetical protein
MLLEPTDKYINHIRKSSHYLNSPKSEFNNSILDLIRGYGTERAIRNLNTFFKLASYRITADKMNQLLKFHQSVPIKKFMKMNVNILEDYEETIANNRGAEIDAYMEKHTTYYSAMFGGGVNYRPSFPFEDNIK